MRELLKGFSDAMWERGHMNLICPECGAVMWLEGDDEATVMLMRYAAQEVDECVTCTYVHAKWENEGVFDV